MLSYVVHIDKKSKKKFMLEQKKYIKNSNFFFSNNMSNIVALTIKNTMHKNIWNRINQHLHLTYHSTDGEISTTHFFSKPIHLPSGITEDDSLGDGQSLIQITKSVKFPFLKRHSEKKIYWKPLNLLPNKTETRCINVKI